MSKVVEAKPPVSPGTEKDPRRETRLNLTISRVLAVGLFTAVILLVVGAVLTLTGRGPSPPSETSIGDIPRAVAAFEPGGFFDLGLLVLLATPVARVVALGVGFARRRAWIFCGLSVFVLVILALSAYLGSRG
jgi:uncharacterized membrane protein